MIHLEVRNESERKRLYRRKELQHLAGHICREENVYRDTPVTRDTPLELSLLFCDDPFITELNRIWRNRRGPTDVLSFSQMDRPDTPLHVLGDIVISLETVARNCGGDRAAMRREVRLLFCHGLLHLLGYTHDNGKTEAEMIRKQALYLDIPEEAAWRGRC
jgi:probable rRNA maturation factor